MSYTKTTWVNNTTPINETNLNKIEQGIYDNSLITEAIADKLNPTDTETYKTAELTEGQITDVIGVKDIIIKGQTEQDGIPTPSAPVDINVVSGSNVIEISNVNKLPYAKSGSYAVSGMTHTSNGKGVYTLNGTATANGGYNWEIEPYTIKNGDYLYCCNSATSSNVSLALINGNNVQIMYAGPVSVNKVVSLNSYAGQTIKYVRTYSNAQTLNNFTLKPMICTTTSVSDFVEHQGNNFEINLGDIELCKIGNYQDYFYKSGSKWYLHKEIGKIILDGITPEKKLIEKHSSVKSETKGFYRFIIADKIAGTNGATNLGISNYFKFVISDAQSAFNNNSSGIWWENTKTCYLILEETTLADANNWLATHNTTIYYVLATATNTEITGILKEQLEAIYNAPLYEQTNITQTNNDLPMVLDITACKDNINGIKAFIRK